MKRLFSLLKLILFIIIITILYLYTNTNSNKEINVKYKKVDVNYKIHFIDIGQGDSTLIQSSNKNILVDTGDYNYRYKLVRYLKANNVEKIDYLFITHPHKDHMGSASHIINNFKIDKFYMPNLSNDITSYHYMIKSLNSKNININNPNIGDIYNIDDIKIEVLNVGSNNSDLNNSSLVLKITINNINILLSSDIDGEVEKTLIDKDIKSDILKVSHHGSKYSSTSQFLYRIKPSVSIISVGENNDYYLPHKVVLDKLEYINSKIYRTDNDGNIIIKTDGNKFEIETKKDDSNESKN